MISKTKWSFMHYLGLYLLATDSSDDIPTRPTTNKVLCHRGTEGYVKMGEVALPL
jgi:hypothetical protein